MSPLHLVLGGMLSSESYFRDIHYCFFHPRPSPQSKGTGLNSGFACGVGDTHLAGITQRAQALTRVALALEGPHAHTCCSGLTQHPQVVGCS